MHPGLVVIIACVVFVLIFALIPLVRKYRRPVDVLESALKIRDGVLYVLGYNSKMECFYPWKKEEFLRYLQEMQAVIDERCPMATIKALVIEPHVAISLWQQGDLTAEHVATVDEFVFRGSRPVQFTIAGWLGDVDLTVSANCFWDSWEFSLEGHPSDVRARPIPDALAAMGGEEFLPAVVHS